MMDESEGKPLKARLQNAGAEGKFSQISGLKKKKKKKSAVKP